MSSTNKIGYYEQFRFVSIFFVTSFIGVACSRNTEKMKLAYLVIPVMTCMPVQVFAGLATSLMISVNEKWPRYPQRLQA